MIDFVDIVCGLTWGDEGKGKITSHLVSTESYDYVCRWAGGSNAGHTVYVDGKVFKTHIVPAGVFHGVKSVIGPGCVLNIEDFFKELKYLSDEGFDTSLVKVSPRTHIVTDSHKTEDRNLYSKTLGTTSSGIGPAYADKSLRVGLRAIDYLPSKMLWNEKFESTPGSLGAKILCEGAQGAWLDIDWGDYPFVTSSHTLPYAACSLGFPPQKIRKIWGGAKAYDTRSGIDNIFPSLPLEDQNLKFLQDKGGEVGVTTGRARSVNWLNIDRLVCAINLTGTTHVVISKCDVLEDSNIKKIKFENPVTYQNFNSMRDFENFVYDYIKELCPLVITIYFSYTPESI